MLTTKQEQKICKKYSTKDEFDLVQCKKCPLVIDSAECTCKANSHYDRKTKEWVAD